MAKKPESAAETLDQIESAADRLADWIQRNPMLLLGVSLGVLTLAGGYGFISSARGQAAGERSDRLAQIERQYRAAMGLEEGALEIIEPANPETARRVREEFLVRFRELAVDAAGTPAGAVAALQAGDIQVALGDEGAAREIWESAQAALGRGAPVRAFLLLRLAASYEEGGEFRAAADRYREAASIQDFPLRYSALADAARCYAQASDTEAALETFAQLERESPDSPVPDYVRAQLEELRARRSARGGGAVGDAG